MPVQPEDVKVGHVYSDTGSLRCDQCAGVYQQVLHVLEIAGEQVGYERIRGSWLNAHPFCNRLHDEGTDVGTMSVAAFAAMIEREFTP